ncbi:MAG: alpha/beta hydrolase fold protein [Spirochaeta sp.]|jgi:alpha-beta hydrolase superfamily lysophospholipase|uniref:alpha/beta hydrolase n=1 Tax=Sphaerochaeta sp. TaxID=1972642 RepID=UPI003D1430A2|nr:alpha/beta hydrolase fold protein [Spirochaeta sp.]
MATIRELSCSDGKRVMYRVWVPEGSQVEAVLLILHGMAEHSQRYDEFATFLNSKGIAVYAPDHRGHGETVKRDGETPGWFAERDGWQRVVKDAYELTNIILAEYPSHSLFLLGHSMGSFLARSLMVQYSDLFDGVILMGTGASQGLLGKIGKMIARSHVSKHGSKHPDTQLDKMSFGAYNKKIPDAKTSFDWLSRDEEQVAKYIEDPLCGFVCTSGFFADLLDGVEIANDAEMAKKLPSDLSLLIISGSEDPVGGFSKGVRKVYEFYRSCGISDITLNLVEGARHELLQETNRDQTAQYLYSWMKQRL